jgi:glutamate-1-semialdehyde 2,1-aminomutase
VPSIARAGEADLELFERELDDFVPPVVFDAHAHLWARSHLPATGWDAFRDMEEEVIDLPAYRTRMAELMPDRLVGGGLCLPGAVGAAGDQVRAQNEFIAKEVNQAGGTGQSRQQVFPSPRPPVLRKGEKAWHGSMLVSPEMEAEYVRQEVRRLGLSGLKCYHVRSRTTPTWAAEIPDYLPEAHVRVANEEGLCVTLHMVRARAVADPSNQHWIRTYCETYPDMQLILAHAARGFNPYHTIEGLPALEGLPNLWCDMAAVTDVGACEAIIEILGHTRLLYGTDFPVSHLRGRCVAIGDGFVWLYEDTLNWNNVSFQSVQPVLIGLESLRVLKQAARNRRLKDSQIEDIFRNNARRLLGKGAAA